MSGELRTGGSWTTIAGGQIFLGGSWRTIIRGEAYKGGAWVTLASFSSTLSLSVSPSPAVFGVHPLALTTRTVTGTVTATPSGGLGPYTYLYETLTYTGSAPSIASPTSATTSVSKSVPANVTYSDSFRVTATDVLGATAHVDFPITFFNEPGDGLGGTS